MSPEMATPQDLETVHGLRAGLALIDARPQDILRIAFSRASAREVEPVTRVLRNKGVPCGLLPDDELDRLAKVQQHEGLYIETRPRTWHTPEALAEYLVKVQGVAIALDRVKNPYNVGAILRSAAFFGVEGMFLGVPALHAGLDAQAVRVAEGGAEHVMLARTPRLADSLAELRKKGVLVVGADGQARTDAMEFRFSRPAVLVMGHEREGLHDRVRAQCDAVVAIRGSGKVDSLNVAVAAGVLIGKLASAPAKATQRRP